MKSKITFLFSIAALFALVISACGASSGETATGAQTFIARLTGAPDSARGGRCGRGQFRRIHLQPR